MTSLQGSRTLVLSKRLPTMGRMAWHRGRQGMELSGTHAFHVGHRTWFVAIRS